MKKNVLNEISVCSRLHALQVPSVFRPFMLKWREQLLVRLITSQASLIPSSFSSWSPSPIVFSAKHGKLSIHKSFMHIFPLVITKQTPLFCSLFCKHNTLWYLSILSCLRDLFPCWFISKESVLLAIPSYIKISCMTLANVAQLVELHPMLGEFSDWIFQSGHCQDYWLIPQ